MTVDEAYERCREIARAEARNFYYGFVLLPPERRAGSTRRTPSAAAADDSVDGEGTDGAAKLASVAARRDELERCYAGDVPPDDAVLVALADTVRRFGVPREHLDALLDGVEMGPARSRATRTSRRSRSTATGWRGRWAW